MEAINRVLRDNVGEYLVSTVFIDLRLEDCIPFPVDHYYETMVFGPGIKGDDCWRCSTLEEAGTQHAKALALVKRLQSKRKDGRDEH